MVLASAGVATADSVTPIGSLQDLINLGQTGVTIGNTVFYNFSYTPSPAPNPAPAASAIAVGAISDGNVGLAFSSSWLSAGGQNQLSSISYSVHQADSSPQLLLDASRLSFDGAILAAGQDTSSTVTETLKTLGGQSTIGTFDVSNNQVNPPPSSLQSSLGFGGTRDLIVTDDISLKSGAVNGGVSSTSFVDVTFTVAAPLPPALWAGPALLALLGLARLARAAQTLSAI